MQKRNDQIIGNGVGQGTNLLTGDYSRGAAGYWVENGEIAFPVEEVTVAGNLKDMYRGISAVGSDVLVRGAYSCGSILVDNMTIAGELTMPKPLLIEVASDVICPWCYIGKRRLEKALAALKAEVEVAHRWLPFQLNPDMPAEGMARAEYRRAKFGSVEQGRALDARVAGKARARASIRLRPHAAHAQHRRRAPADRPGQTQGRQDPLVDALFRAYFEEARRHRRRRSACRIAESPAWKVAGRPQSMAGEVAEQEGAVRELGISGVPTFIFDRNRASPAPIRRSSSRRQSGRRLLVNPAGPNQHAVDADRRAARQFELRQRFGVQVQVFHRQRAHHRLGHHEFPGAGAVHHRLREADAVAERHAPFQAARARDAEHRFAQVQALRARRCAGRGLRIFPPFREFRLDALRRAYGLLR